MQKPKGAIKNVVKLAIVIAVFIGIVLIVFHFTIVPKDPVTANQVWDVMVAQGYEPKDITQQYYEKDSGFKNTLNTCIAFEKDDIHFEFYVFKNKSNAADLYGQAYTKIILNKNALPKVETKKRIANYIIYTLRASGSYNVAIYVENTAVYAYCDEKNENEINKILDAIDYLN